MPIAILPRTAPARRLPVTTPGRMATALAIIAALAVAAGITTFLVMADIRQSVRTIAADAEPSVVAAQVLGARLSGMDAEALNDALNDNGGASGTSAAFRDHQAAVNDRIVAASRNITYGEAEAAPIRALMAGLEQYLESLGEARWMARDNPWLAIQRARWSSRLLNEFLRPHAAELEQANLAPLERQYAYHQSSSLVLAALAGAVLLALLAALVVTQLYLARRTRRLLNLPLVGATLLALATLLGFTIGMLAEQADMRAAKQDAFDSLHALYGATSSAYQLTALRSMWLLDPATRAETAASFAATARKLLAIDTSDSKATHAITEALFRAEDLEGAGHPAEALAAAPKLGGLLGDELGNVTFGMAERRPATDAIAMLLNYLETDREVQSLELARRHTEAVALATSTRPGGRVAAFSALDHEIDRTIAVNQSEFDRRSEAGAELLRQMPWATSAALAVSLLLAGAGVWQRWREYR